MTKWLLLLASALLGLSACSPNDTRVKTVKELLDEGRVLEFTEPGFRHNGCKEKPNAMVQVDDEDERSRVVVGKQGTVLAPGIYNCQTVRARTSLGKYNSKLKRVDPLSGDVVVTKISWARIDKVNKGLMKGKYFESSEQFYNYIDNQKRRLEAMRQNYVTIIEFGYVRGSAVDEKAIVDQDNKLNETDGFTETTEDGKCVAKCFNKPWVDTSIPQDVQPALLDKTLGSWFQMGQSNGFRQGDVIDLKTNRTDTSGFAKAKVKKIKKFKVWAMKESHFILNGFDYSKIRAAVEEANKIKKEDWMTVTDFEIIPPQGAEIKKADCTNTIHIDRNLPLAGEVRVHKDSAPCGELVNVVTVNKDDSVLEIPVRVKARMDDAQSTTTTLILERLDGVEQEIP